MLWVVYRRRRQHVRVIVPRDEFLANHPPQSDDPPAHISPFIVTPQYAKTDHPEYDGGHEGVLLLAGPKAMGDRKKKYSLYDAPEERGSSHSLHGPQGSQRASTPAHSRQSSHPTSTATYAPSNNGSNRETVNNFMTPNYAHTALENRDLQSALSTQTAAVIPLRPLRLTIPPSPAPPPAPAPPPILQRMSLYAPAITGAETSQKKVRM